MPTLFWRKSHKYPGEQAILNDLFIRIRIVKAASFMLGFTARCVKSCEQFFQEEESHRCSFCPIRVYTRIRHKKLDARLLQEGRQRLKLLQFVLHVSIY